MPRVTSLPFGPSLTPCPPPRLFRIHDGQAAGVRILETEGGMEDCEIWNNKSAGVQVEKKGVITVVGCSIRDHSGESKNGGGCGVWLGGKAKATMGPGNVFARNATGNVVREKFAPAAPPSMAALWGGAKELRPAVHPHALTYAQAVNAGQKCDACRISLTPRSGAFQCAECKFSACIACFDTWDQA